MAAWRGSKRLTKLPYPSPLHRLESLVLMPPNTPALSEAIPRSTAELWGWACVPVVLLALAAAPQWMDDPWLAGLCLAGVALVSAFTVWRLLQAGATRDALQDPQAGQAGTQQEAAVDLLLDVLPAWQQHVEIVKTQTEQAVERLTSSFASVLGELDAAGIGHAGQSQGQD